MSKFTTNIKTNYTNNATTENKKLFTSKFQVKKSSEVVSQENRVLGQRFASRLVK